MCSSLSGYVARPVDIRWGLLLMIGVVVDYACPGLSEAVSSLVTLGVEEVVVVDNHGSTPWEALRRTCPQLRQVRPEHNRGFGAGVNAALRGVDEGLALLLNPDAVVADWDTAMTANAMRERGAAIAAPNVRGPAGELEPTHGDFQSLADLGRRVLGRPSRVKVARELAGTEILEVDWVSGAAMLVDVAAFWSVGGFDERYFLYYEDQDLCRRLRRQGWKTLRVGHGAVVHERGGTQSGRLVNLRYVVPSLLRFLADR